ncbi:MAG: 2-oxoglutarate dehydrogenase E1 component [Pseudomonadota bacterium]
MKALLSTSLLDGGNVIYLEEQYEKYLKDPNSVAPEWRNYFERLPVVDGVAAQDIPHSEVRQHFYQLTRYKGQRPASSASDATLEHERKQVHVQDLIASYRMRGHQLAKLDPLKRYPFPEVKELDLHENGLSGADLDTVFRTGSMHGAEEMPLRDILEQLEQTYCSSIGSEYVHIPHTTQKLWLQQRLESVNAKPVQTPETRKWILQRLTAGEGIERYLHSKYVGQKRFSLEGGEGLIVIMSELVRRAGDAGVREMIIGMAHRGRLNLLINILGKHPADLFSEFEGKHSTLPKASLSSGDVKYHQGFSSDIKTSAGEMHLALAFNPSHLEIVSPVVEGSVRSRQDRHLDTSGDYIVPIAIHGDAAFAGQGVVMETFNMADSRGYSTKGTIHIIVNNQIGFTTSNKLDSRSTFYSSDVAKMINAPIFHVNGDDPEAVFFVTQLALDFRMQFKKDVIIDMICYRRHGHNEADEPSATQPMMYKAIKALPTTRKLYGDKLTEEGVIAAGEADAMVASFRDELDAGHCVAENILEDANLGNEYTIDWRPYLHKEWREPGDTRVPTEKIKELSNKLTTLPDGLALHPRVKKIIDDRRKMAAGAQPFDWGAAETLAYATLLNDGYAVRISGQDCGRGTFFHRHAVLHNQKDGESYVPLRNLAEDQPNFLVIDSVLSEEAVLAFEYGYATADPDTLVIWEAQFGDFANGAQVVIDQFISSGETKWSRLCGLTLLLPHGYEGQGPEHSSARLERYLQLCAEDNMQVCVPSTPAQVYHMLRRQMVRPLRRPLIAMSPKSLLRHKLAVSTLDELASGEFQPVLDEIDDINPAKVKRLIFCSGKVFYDLIERRRAENIDDIAIVRLEQIYPFPYPEMQAIIKKYNKAATVLWCQEEPRNQGAWRSNRHRIDRVITAKQKFEYAGRVPSASTAVGYANLHMQEQAKLVDEALGLVPNSQAD